jgi:hypothetical protein
MYLAKWINLNRKTGKKKKNLTTLSDAQSRRKLMEKWAR